MRSFLYAIWEIVEVALVAVISVLIIRNFLVQPFLVNGASMEPNFHNNDYLLIDEVSYRFREPQRGEVMVFKYPGNENYYYIKRVIGLPGEEVKIKDGKILIFNGKNSNGIELDEKYLPFRLDANGKDEEIKLKDGEYFVMGDNRQFSFDSRNWGPVKKNEIIGLVRVRLWPIDSVMAFEKPVY
ncbi:signal peptidase I [Candidatus Wolfebacteria bacterium]|nr:signal peptidase I [Candidatus Wolfebacteria bacterium]